MRAARAATGAIAIAPKPPGNKGLDYVYLRSRGLRLVQALASDVWTDYNEHDPGVTTIEQLCYALTELSYRAELPMADLLAQPGTGDLQPRRQGMFIARRILPCNPVTSNDYRKLIVDRVRDVRNVWVTPRIPPDGSPEVNGLYDIAVYAPGVHDGSGAGTSPRAILETVRRVYARHRNLCEDVHAIRLLSPWRTVVHADVSIGARQPAEPLLAAVFFALGRLLAPELPRQPLNARLDAGESPDEIFNGPLLLRGFIRDDDLQPPITSLGVNDIVSTIGQVPGVVGVRHVSVQTGAGGDSERYRANASIPVPSGAFLHLDTGPAPEGTGFSIRLFRSGKACAVDTGAVERALQLLWMAYRRDYPLAAQYDEYFGVPAGQWRDLAHYYSIQNQYPDTYGIGDFGLPADATDERRGQARQFKAYLLPFEQLLADYFAQLAHVRDLFSIAPDDWRTYYWQSLEPSVPDVAPVLAPGYREGLDAIVAGGDAAIARRNQFLGFLLSLYANQLYAERDSADAASPGRDGSAVTTQDSLLRSRLALMRRLVPATRSRGRAFDHQRASSPRNFAGMEIKCRIEMGMDLDSHQPLSEALVTTGLTIARATDEVALGRPSRLDARTVDECVRPVLAYPTPATVPDRVSAPGGVPVTEDLITWGCQIDNLFVGRLPEGDDVILLCRTPNGGWILVGVHTSLDHALAEAHACCQHLMQLHRARTQLYIVEHTLLRFGRRPRRQPDGFVYSFTLTAVVSLPCEARLSRDNRTAVEEIVRENTPANTVALVCVLDPWSMLRFESLNLAWRSALRSGRPFPIALTSARLRRFLERHRPSTSRAQL